MPKCLPVITGVKHGLELLLNGYYCHSFERPGNSTTLPSAAPNSLREMCDIKASSPSNLEWSAPFELGSGVMKGCLGYFCSQ